MAEADILVKCWRLASEEEIVLVNKMAGADILEICWRFALAERPRVKTTKWVVRKSFLHSFLVCGCEWSCYWLYYFLFVYAGPLVVSYKQNGNSDRCGWCLCDALVMIDFLCWNFRSKFSWVCNHFVIAINVFTNYFWLKDWIMKSLLQAVLIIDDHLRWK